MTGRFTVLIHRSRVTTPWQNSGVHTAPARDTGPNT
jgi:hypothetical protein